MVVDDAVKEVSQILPIMELVKKVNKPLVLFSKDLREDPTSTMVYNNMKGIVSSVAVNIPWAAGVERENLVDIATLTGATLVDNQHVLMMEDV